jgi:hypothetical protein
MVSIFSREKKKKKKRNQKASKKKKTYGEFQRPLWKLDINYVAETNLECQD